MIMVPMVRLVHTKPDFLANVVPTEVTTNSSVPIIQPMLCQMMSNQIKTMMRREEAPKRKKSKKKAKKPASHSSLPQVSFDNSDSIKLAKKAPDMTIFMDRLLLIVHTLLALSKEAPDLVSRTKCQKHLDDEWLQRPLILQCCMSVSVLLDNRKVSSIALSDNCSTLSFVSAHFIKKHKLPVMGTLRGNLQTSNLGHY